MILAIRTDKPKAELHLVRDGEVANQIIWQAHRELSNTIFIKLEELLEDRTFSDLTGIVVFKGPGSFTGLRIGATVANTLAYSLEAPIVGQSGDGWINAGVTRIGNGESDKIVVPEYGGEANITKPRK